eukprot:1144555-Pelagomonas_calceolata.AAC.4
MESGQKRPAQDDGDDEDAAVQACKHKSSPARKCSTVQRLQRLHPHSSSSAASPSPNVTKAKVLQPERQTAGLIFCAS